MQTIDQALEKLQKSNFRAKFYLAAKDKEYVREKGFDTIRAHAEEWHVDPDKIAVMGSSAGGHLAATLGMLWNDPEIVETLGIEQGSNRPNAIVLNYTPVISNEQLLSGSTRKIHGEDKTREEYMALSLERFVGEHTPPCFMWHTLEDRTVPVEHPLLFSLALRKHNIPFELHVFEKGAHGLSTCQADVASSPAVPPVPVLPTSAI